MIGAGGGSAASPSATSTRRRVAGLEEARSHVQSGGPTFLRRNGMPAWAGGSEREYSEETARAIDDEVRQMVEQTYARVRALLAKQKDTLLRAAAVLKERETLDGEELKALLPPAAPAAS